MAWLRNIPLGPIARLTVYDDGQAAIYTVLDKVEIPADLLKTVIQALILADSLVNKTAPLPLDDYQEDE